MGYDVGHLAITTGKEALTTEDKGKRRNSPDFGRDSSQQSPRSLGEAEDISFPPLLTAALRLFFSCLEPDPLLSCPKAGTD
ncbi:Tyrosine-Protein Kinase Baz1B [Manis pentadactyla]|nr:Tyrosine-Protein Kinase Baz1B [Manis pentadactyla]